MLLFSFCYGWKSPRESTDNSKSSGVIHAVPFKRIPSLCPSSSGLPHHRWIVNNNKHVSFVPFLFPDSQSIIFCTYQNRGVTHAPWPALSNLEFVVKATYLKLNLLNLKSTTCFAENLTNLILMSQLCLKVQKFQTQPFFSMNSIQLVVHKYINRFCSLFKQGVVAPLLREILLILPFVPIGADATEEPLTCPSSVCMCHSFQSTAHLSFIGTQLSLSWLWERPTTGAGESTNKPHLRLGVSVFLWWGRLAWVCVCVPEESVTGWEHHN